MKVEDQIISLNQDVRSLKQERVHCCEMHDARLSNLNEKFQEQCDEIDRQGEELGRVSLKGEKTSHSLTLVAKQVRDLIELRKSMNTKLWAVLISLFISFITFVGSAAYKNFRPINSEEHEMKQRLENIEKMMENLSKNSSKELKNEKVIGSKP